jgi:hypothetical protein
MSVSKLKFEFNKAEYSNFVDKLQDLAHISDVIKLKIDKDFIMAYSLVASDSAVLCLKNYYLKTSKYLNGWKTDSVFDFVISSSAKFCKNLRFFETFDVIKVEIHYKPSYENPDVMHIRTSPNAERAVAGGDCGVQGPLVSECPRFQRPAATTHGLSVLTPVLVSAMFVLPHWQSVVVGFRLNIEYLFLKMR